MEELHLPNGRSPAFTQSERELIRQQLEKMLASPLFKNSKRYPALLRFVVESTLEGRTADLKERTLGVDVFGRDPDYDTNADPIVRATAGEIRKRIAQYYHESGHDLEVRIDLSARSYIPEFELPSRLAAIPQVPPPLKTVVMPAPETPGNSVAWWRSRRVLAVGGGVLLLVLAGWWLRSRWMVAPLDLFWRPILDSSNNVLMCVGQRQYLGTTPEPGQTETADMPSAVHGPVTLFQLYYMGSQNVEITDVKTLGRLSGLLQARGKTVQILGERSTNFADLRNGPVVLVGAFNNDWTLRLSGPMRFVFARQGDTFYIEDRRDPGKRNLAVNYRMPYLSLTEDYAVISRVLDPTTDRIVVIAAGLTGYGTAAAGEFLTDPSYFESGAKGASRHWERQNIQFLISTRVINGNSGPPRVLARYTW